MILLYYATKHYSVSIQRSFVNHNLLRNSLKTTRSKETTKFTRIFTEFNSSLEQSSRTIITSSWRDFEKCLTLATDIMAARSRALCSYARKEEEKKEESSWSLMLKNSTCLVYITRFRRRVFYWKLLYFICRFPMNLTCTVYCQEQTFLYRTFKVHTHTQRRANRQE